MTLEELAEFKSYDWWPSEARINAGFAGHDREIVVNVDDYDWRDPIPDLVVEALSDQLPDWMIENRGTRIECHPTGHFAGGFEPEHIPQVITALDAIGLVTTSVLTPSQKWCA